MRDVSRFLTTHNLQSVCPFIADIIPVDITPANDDTPNFVYHSPIPDITTKPLSSFVHLSPDIGAAKKIFEKDVSFVWQTADTGENIYEHGLLDTNVVYDVQNTMSLVYKKVYGDSYAMAGIFNRILQLGLDISGIRLLYPTSDVLQLSPLKSTTKQTPHEILTSVGPIIAIALRGPFARSKWLDAVGPSDPVLARKTDPNSLSALYGGESKDENMIFFPRNPARTTTELIRWFGGRVKNPNSVEIGIPYAVVEQKTRKNKEIVDLPPQRPSAALTATVKGQVVLVLRPLVAPRCLGLVVRICETRGYHIRGVRRLVLNQAKATTLGIQMNKDAEVSQYYTMFLLDAENAWHNAASLVQDFIVQFCLLGIAGELQKRVDHPVTSLDLFHVTSLSPAIIASICPEFTKCPEQRSYLMPGVSRQNLHTNHEMEQILVLIVIGHEPLKRSGIILAELLQAASLGKANITDFTGFELLGMKWLPTLTMTQANDITSYEIGDQNWRASIQELVNGPAMVVVLRGVNAFQRLDSLLKADGINKRGKTSPSPECKNSDKIMSTTADQAFQFVSLFFNDNELMGDNSARYSLDYFPSSHKDGSKQKCSESIISTMLAGPCYFTTFLLIKPSAVQRHFGSILKKLVQEKFENVAMRMVQLGEKDAAYFGAPDFVTDEQIRKQTRDHLTSSPSIVLCLRRENAVKKLSDLIGPYDPMTARRSSQFLWRGVFGSTLSANGLHAPDTYKQAVTEQCRYFKGLCTKDTSLNKLTQLPCPCSDDVISSARHVIHTQSNGVSTFLQTSCLLLPPCLMNANDHDARPPYITIIDSLISHGYVMPPCLMNASDHDTRPPYITIIDSLISHGFSLVGLRMLWLTESQAADLPSVLHTSLQVAELTSGPSLVLAVQRDNAILTFDSLLSRSSHGDSVVTKYGKDMLRPNSVAMADTMLAYFFDILHDDSNIEIHTTSTTNS